jgi:LacI family transcriptional regulator
MFDVARRAGVNQSTVSLALREDPRIPAETQRRIADIARQMNYVPNHLARSLSGGRSRMIGLMLADMANQFFVPHLEEIRAGTEAAGLALSVIFCDWDPQREERGLMQFCENRVEGIIWSPAACPRNEVSTIVRKIQASGARCVMLGTNDQAIPATRVCVQEGDAVHAGAEYLVGLGHHHIGIATATKMAGARAELHRNRLARMRHAIGECGGRVDAGDVFDTADNDYGGVRIAAEIAARPPADRPTAIFAADDRLARAMVAGLLTNGIRLPEDLSVLGFDNAPGDANGEVSITSVSLESREIGRRAIELLVEMINRRSAPDRKEAFVLAPRIVERASCGRPCR